MLGVPETSFPKADEQLKEYFRSLVPDEPAVEVRPMFGNLGAFVNRNMFLALFGPKIAVRLPDQEREELLEEEGAELFEPMPGRTMKEYVVLPEAWRAENPERIHRWVERSFGWASTLPPKEK